MAKKAASSSPKRFAYERELLERGCTLIAGVDEAGRGPLAGPVVAAAVVFSVDQITLGLRGEWKELNDSKQLTQKQRERFYELITTETGIQYAISIVDVEMIDRINILQATHHGMNEALAKLSVQVQHVLVDGLKVKSLRWPQTPIVKGDSLSYSIAAASVLAKVTRDRMMHAYDVEFPGYGFAAHKGYGTEQHLAALAKQGPCAIHRKTFAPVRMEQGELFG
ncbi:MAG TPA: ribonuclease HII [Verrucomicrobiae bacterium]